MSEASRDRRAFILRKLHSLSGVIPVGLFLVEHLWTNSAILGGQASFDHAVAKIQDMPFLPAIEIGGIFLPLAFHAIYGVRLALQGKPNPGSYPFTRNWLYVLQRVSGIVIFAFVAAHLWEFRIQKWLFGMSTSSFYPTLTAHMSWTWAGVPWIALGYLLGIAASLFHLANGLVGFCMSWGITSSRKAQKRVGLAFGALGGALFLLSAVTVVELATGSRLLFDAEAGKSRPCGPEVKPPSP
ncbi:Succinate dehydrogenase cytochrome b558 subunit [Labilithrix luteola]|uniref:Succinate dehydrogenase cytochrome b558 subunit n=1 Tax=Labilithrix luteola TaxID=1391654 RepID=A0A0K1PUW3_9BACT|nr:succinate dehydrogenase [Labilithrix luteola]AKU97166.1 Succinate dehydrogenase cytochrome b558 subunit [Labilithrix luteola]